MFQLVFKSGAHCVDEQMGKQYCHVQQCNCKALNEPQLVKEGLLTHPKDCLYLVKQKTSGSTFIFQYYSITLLGHNVISKHD